MIKWGISFIMLVFAFSACETNGNKKTLRIGDSLSLPAPAGDSGKKFKSSTGTEDQDPEPTPQQVMAQIIDAYNKVQVIDSTVLLGLDKFSIKLTHKCLHDSGVIVPAKYLKPYGLKEFITHNFVSVILVRRNDSVIVNRIVSKQDFGKIEDENLLKYRILILPYIDKVDNDKQQITIDYSLSIPLTDVGQSVRLIINRDGALQFKSGGPD